MPPPGPQPDDGLTDLTDLGSGPASAPAPFGGLGAPAARPAPRPPVAPGIIPASAPAPGVPRLGIPPPAPLPPAHPGAPRPAAAAKPEPGSGPPPTLMDSMEAALRVPFAADEIFAAQRALAEPDLPAMVLHALFWALTGQLVLLVLALMLHPAAAGLGALPSLLVLLGGTAAAVPASVAAAGLLHALSLCAGGRPSFARSYQLLGLLGCVLPVSATIVFLPLPLIWIAPTVLATYLAVRGISVLHDAPDGQVWLIVGGFGALLAGGQFAFHAQIESYNRDLGTRITLYRNEGSGQGGDAVAVSSERAAPMPGVRESRAPGIPATPGMSMDPQRAYSQGGSLAGITGEPAAGPDSTAMIRAEPAEQGPPEVPQGASPDDLQSMSTNILGMINAQIEKDPSMLQRLPPDQRANFQKLLRQANRQAGDVERKHGPAKPMSPERTNAMIQQLMEQYGAQGGGPAAPAPRSRRRARVSDGE